MHSKFLGDRPSHPRLMFHWFIWVGHLDTVSRAGGVCLGQKDLLCHCRQYRKYDMVTAVFPKPGLALDAEPT